MSGGRYNYAFRGVEEMADSLESYRASPERLAFAGLLRRVAKAMHDIEWVDDCDMGEGEEVPAIMACISPADVQENVLKQLSDAVKLARTILGEAGA